MLPADIQAIRAVAQYRHEQHLEATRGHAVTEEELLRTIREAQDELYRIVNQSWREGL